MGGYLTSNKDFYKGNYHKFNLDKAVAEAGGNSFHLQLFNYLLTPTFTYDNKIFYDSSAPTSLLFLFPPKIQILFAALFTSENLLIQEHITNLLIEDPEIEHSSNSPNLDIILKVNNGISKLPLNTNIIKLFDKNYQLPNSYIEKNLKFILCLNITTDIYSKEDKSIREKINRIIKVTNFSSNYINKFTEIAIDNNRLEAGVIIGQVLGYSTNAIQTIAGVIEKWQLQNLST